MSPNVSMISSAASPTIRALVQQMLVAPPTGRVPLAIGSIKNAAGAPSHQRMTGSLPWYGAYTRCHRNGVSPSLPSSRPGTTSPGVWPSPAGLASVRASGAPNALATEPRPPASATPRAPAAWGGANRPPTTTSAPRAWTATSAWEPQSAPLRSPALVAAVSRSSAAPATAPVATETATAANAPVKTTDFTARWAALNTPAGWVPFAQQVTARPLWPLLGVRTIARIPDRPAEPAPAREPHRAPPSAARAHGAALTGSAPTRPVPPPAPSTPARIDVPTDTGTRAARLAFLTRQLG